MTAWKNWIMIIITLVFVILYVGALLGWLKPFSDAATIMRLEPIIFAIVGFYFGRMPAKETENNLKEEIERQIKKAEAAQSSCEQTQQEREILEEKLKNVQRILDFTEKKFELDVRGKKMSFETYKISVETLQHSMKTAVNVLNS